MSHSLIKLVLSHEHSIAIVPSLQNFHLHIILYCNSFKALTNLEVSKSINFRNTWNVAQLKKRVYYFICYDKKSSQKGYLVLTILRSSIFTFLIAGFTCFHAKCTFCISFETVNVQPILNLQNGTCKMFKVTCHL